MVTSPPSVFLPLPYRGWGGSHRVGWAGGADGLSCGGTQTPHPSLREKSGRTPDNSRHGAWGHVLPHPTRARVRCPSLHPFPGPFCPLLGAGDRWGTELPKSLSENHEKGHGLPTCPAPFVQRLQLQFFVWVSTLNWLLKHISPFYFLLKLLSQSWRCGAISSSFSKWFTWDRLLFSGLCRCLNYSCQPYPKNCVSHLALAPNHPYLLQRSFFFLKHNLYSVNN